jgi:hypothetical protein
MESVPRVLSESRTRHSASERGPAGGIRGMVGHRAEDGEEVSVGGIIATEYFSHVCCGQIVLSRSGSAECWSHSLPSRVAKCIRAMGSKVVPRLTHRGGVSADMIQASWANAMQSEERVVIRGAAAVILS